MLAANQACDRGRDQAEDSREDSEIWKITGRARSAFVAGVECEKGPQSDTLIENRVPLVGTMA